MAFYSILKNVFQTHSGAQSRLPQVPLRSPALGTPVPWTYGTVSTCFTGGLGRKDRVTSPPTPSISTRSSWTRRHKAQERSRASGRSPDRRACPSCGGEAHKVRLSFRYQSLHDKSLHECKYPSWNHLPNSKDTF